MTTHNTIPLELLPAKLRRQLVIAYERAIGRETHLLTFNQAALVYGYTSRTLRSHVCNGLIRAVHTKEGTRLEHREMRRYRKQLLKSGRPMKAVPIVPRHIRYPH